MRRNLIFTLSLLWIGAMLSSCGPSQEALDATETALAIAKFTSQTAQGPTHTPQPSRTPLPSPTPTPLPLALLEASFQILEESGSYHFDLEVQTTVRQGNISQEMPLKLTGDFGSRDSYQAKLFISTMGVTIDIEMIKVDGLTYITDPQTGKWGLGETVHAPYDPAVFSAVAPTEIQNLSYAGQESIAGITVSHLTGTIPAEAIGEHGEDLQLDYWIGVEDYLIRRISLAGEIEYMEQGFRSGSVPGSISMTMTMTLSDFGKRVEIQAPDIGPAYQLAGTPYDQMTVYQSGLYPFTIQYPADWAQQPVTPDISAEFSSAQGATIVLAEQDLLALGLEDITLEEYGDLTLTYINSFMFSPKILSRTQFTTLQGVTGEVIAFTLQNDAFEARRFYALHDNRVAFNATFIAPIDIFPELESMINYSFSTFRVSTLECLSSFPATEALHVLSPMDRDLPRIERLEIALWPEFDTGDVLVIFRIQLAWDHELPETLPVPIPSNVGVPHAVAWQADDGQLINAYYERVTAGDWTWIEITAESHTLQLEYYASLMVADPWKGYEFIWPGGLQLNSSSYEIMWPSDARDMAVFPLFNVQNLLPNGILLSRAELGPQASTSPFSIRLCYAK